ncbi:MAG: hypothetical protein KA004_13805 [Verrucomicrobiales bacterium]|nr:hypothetical protein [Verrucomicrobiales bacterium]
MRLLIVSPHFPPTNAADMQRVRLLVPYLAEHGVQAEVLAVEPSDVASPLDHWLADGLPPEVPVHRVKALGTGWSRLPGLGTLGFRALRALRKKGDELLGRKAESGKRKGENEKLKAESEKRKVVVGGRAADDGSASSFQLSTFSSQLLPFDLVYFSTTVFPVHVLGPRWKKRFGVPFVMDYQDPWVSDYYREHPEVVPPGGRLKYSIVEWLARRQEPRVLRECAGITSVSAAYPRQLQARYPWLAIEEFTAKTQRTPRGAEAEDEESRDPVEPCEATFPSQPSGFRHQVSGFRFPLSAFRSQLFSLVLPFPGDERDLERARESGIRQSVFDPNDAKQHWVYVGVCPPSMLFSIRALFEALSRLRSSQPGLFETLKLHFAGTSYAPAGTAEKVVEPLAAHFGLQDLVSEMTDRIPYSEALRCLLDADLLLVPGTDDPGYTASKIYPYLLAEKPLLAVFHEQSSVCRLLEQVGGGHLVPFSSGATPEQIARRICDVPGFLELSPESKPLDREAFEPYSAKSQAKMLAGFFRRIVAAGRLKEPVRPDLC